jgi:phenylpropionate dioxygenase-like ring-hydroxylating dioxygenase large terminal subunit
MAQLEQAPQPDVLRLVEHLKRSWTDQMDDQLSVDPAIYRDPEVARHERERVFARVPVIVAHSSELPETGSFLTTRLPNNEVLVVRQDDGGVRAFVNACRHRGSMIEARASGTCPKRLQCPYHGWSYNLDGSLKSATHQVSFGEFDHIESGLVRLPVQERHGFVWVVDAADAQIDVAQWLGADMDAILGSYGLAEHVCFQSGGFEEAANWKVMQDAFLDGYHIQFVHRETAAKLTYTNVLALEDFGRHSRFLSPRKSLGKLLDESNGNELTEGEIRPHVNLSHGLLPNATLLYLPNPDQFQLLSFFPHPRDPSWCRMEMRVIVPRLEDSGWDAERWQHIWSRNWQINMDIIRDEDLPIARDSQRAIQSASAGPLIFGRNEIANQVFHRELARLLHDDGARARGGA